MPKKNEEPLYIPDTPKTFAEQKIIQVSFWKAFTVLSGAVLVSIVGTAFTIGSILNTDHFTLARAVDDINEIKAEKLDIDIYTVQQESILKELAEIKRLLQGTN